jgi:hypothetical protein
LPGLPPPSTLGYYLVALGQLGYSPATDQPETLSRGKNALAYFADGTSVTTTKWLGDVGTWMTAWPRRSWPSRASERGRIEQLKKKTFAYCWLLDIGSKTSRPTDIWPMKVIMLSYLQTLGHSAKKVESSTNFKPKLSVCCWLRDIGSKTSWPTDIWPMKVIFNWVIASNFGPFSQES